MLHDMLTPEVTTVLRWLLRGILATFLVFLVRRRPESDDEDDDEEDDENEQQEMSSSYHELKSKRGEHANGNLKENYTRNGIRDGSMAAMNGGGGYSKSIDNNGNRSSGGMNGGGKGGGKRDVGPGAHREYMQQQMPINAGGVRQRRFNGNHFDSVIDRVSKPKEMWEVRKDASNQVFDFEGKDYESVKPTNGGPCSPSGATTGNTAALGGGGNGNVANWPGTAPKNNGGDNRSERAPRLQLSPPSANANGHENKDDRLPRPTLHGHERPVTYIVFNQECNLLFTCGKDKLVSVWSFPDGECLGSYRGHNGAVWACSATASSNWLVTCGADRLIIVWNAKDSKEVVRTELVGVVRSVEWAKSGGPSNDSTERFVACYNRFGSHHPAIVMYSFSEETYALKEINRISNLPSAASQVRWGKKDQSIVSAHECGKLVFWHASTGAQLHSLQAHDAAISKFSWNIEQDLIATASQDKTVKVWDLAGSDDGGQKKFCEKLLFKAETNRPLNAVALGPLTRAQALNSSDKRPACCMVIAAGGQDIREVATTGSSSEQFETLLFQLGAGQGETADPAPLVHIGSAKGHFGPVHTLAFTADGASIASGSEDGCVRLSMVDSIPPIPTPVPIAEKADVDAKNGTVDKVLN